MMNRHFALFALVLLGFLAFVAADASDIYQIDQAGIDSSVTLKKGWNLVTNYAIMRIFDNVQSYQEDLKNQQIRAIFMYDKYSKQYIRLYPDKEQDKLDVFINQVNIDTGASINDYAGFTNGALWVYSDREQTLKFRTTDGPIKINYVGLKAGWNFLAITPDMVGKKIGDYKGTCVIEKMGDYLRNNWDVAVPQDSNTFADQDGDVWYGRVIKVRSDCVLGSSTINPPALP